MSIVYNFDRDLYIDTDTGATPLCGCCDGSGQDLVWLHDVQVWVDGVCSRCNGTGRAALQ